MIIVLEMEIVVPMKCVLLIKICVHAQLVTTIVMATILVLLANLDTSNRTIGEQACTQVTKGYFAVDGSGTSVNTAAVDQEICTVGTFSAAGATACTTAQQGYYTVDANGDALSDPWQGAVAEAQAGEGFSR